MTSIRESIRRLLGNSKEIEQDKPRPEYSYRIYWTKMVREWSQAKRDQIAANLSKVLADEDFEPTMFERRYRVEGLDGSEHAGASLLALREVLQGFARYGTDNQEETA